MTESLLCLAALGWLGSVLGAVLTHRGSVTLSVAPDDPDIIEVPRLSNPAAARWGLTLIVSGATFGAGGTILAVVATS